MTQSYKIRNNLEKLWQNEFYEKQKYKKEMKMQKIKSDSQYDLGTIALIIAFGCLAIGFVSNAVWILAGAALALFLWSQINRGGNGIFRLPLRVGELEEKQDDMARLFGLRWFKIPEQKFYHKTSFDPQRYDAKKKRDRDLAYLREELEEIKEDKYDEQSS